MLRVEIRAFFAMAAASGFIQVKYCNFKAFRSGCLILGMRCGGVVRGKSGSGGDGTEDSESSLARAGGVDPNSTNVLRRIYLNATTATSCLNIGTWATNRLPTPCQYASVLA